MNDRYAFRNTEDVPSIHCRTSFYHNSLIPSSIRSWNALPHSTQSSDSLHQFKRLLFNRQTSPAYYYTGPRKFQILHTRLRLGCSSLSDDLFRKNIIPSRACVCGQVETVRHYLLFCNLFSVQRNILLHKIRQLNPSLVIDANLLLTGDCTLSDDLNAKLFKIVFEYIDSTKRFN